jgi:hypothetical protein
VKARRVGILSAFILTAIVTTPSYAADPRAGGGEPSSDKNLVLPLTPEIQASLRKKQASLKNFSAKVARGAQVGISAVGLPASYTLSTRARHQHRWYYCGPAVVQVASNYTWGIVVDNAGSESTTGNQYKQSTISSRWTKTDVTLQTYLADFITGMNKASDIPFDPFYVQWHAPTWTEFHNAVANDAVNWFMPAAAGITPREPGSSYFLASWRNATPGNYGHYIALRGYSGFSQSSAIMYYNDSSGGKDEVSGETILGSTGSFTDVSFTVYKTMMNHNKNLIY